MGYFIRVVVTGSNDFGSDTSASELMAAVGIAPSNTVPAGIDNMAPSAGAVLNAAPGSADGVPDPTFAYQWQRCSDGEDLSMCVDIEEATDGTYLLVDDDVDS